MNRRASVVLAVSLSLAPLAALAVPPPPPPPARVEAASAVVADATDAKRIEDAEAECKAACERTRKARQRLAQDEASEAKAKVARGEVVAAVASKAGLVAEGRTYAAKVATETVDGVETKVVKVVAYEPEAPR